MTKRHDLRAIYIDGWNTMDAEKLVSSVSEDFVFGDPCEPELIGKSQLAHFMPVWPEKLRKLGGSFDFEMVDRVVSDQDGWLTEWYWWRVPGLKLEGSALIKTTDRGVALEKFGYFKTPWQLFR